MPLVTPGQAATDPLAARLSMKPQINYVQLTALPFGGPWSTEPSRKEIINMPIITVSMLSMFFCGVGRGARGLWSCLLINWFTAHYTIDYLIDSLSRFIGWPIFRSVSGKPQVRLHTFKSICFVGPHSRPFANFMVHSGHLDCVHAALNTMLSKHGA